MGIKVREPTFTLTYDTEDITADISKLLVELNYTDVFDSESDEISIKVENTQGQWMHQWYPELGAKLKLKMGYKNEPLIECGDFEIDEIDFSHPPSQVSIKALATGVSTTQRTRFGRAYDDKDLKTIAEEIAAENELTIEGQIEDIKFRRITQAHENDLGFLERLANDFGYGFSIKDKKLVFIKYEDLKKQGAIDSIDIQNPENVISWTLKDKIKDIAEDAKVSYFDPEKRQTFTEQTDKVTAYKTSRDQLKLNNRSENAEHAKKKAQAALDKQNEDKSTGSITVPGNPKLVAGANVTIENAGPLSGKWQISSSTHSMTSSGYTTSIAIKKVYGEQILLN